MANQMNAFVSYAHEDKALYERLEVSLKQIEELINVWGDSQIIAGSEWDKDIRQKLKEARIILLLISPDFIASRYITEVEVKDAMERHKRNEAEVIPIILRPAYWKDKPYSKLEALPKDGKAITKWDNRDDAFLDIVERIKEAIDKLNEAPADIADLSDSQKEEKEFHEALLRLDFEEQKKPFRPFHAYKDKKYLGAFVVYGPPDYGQFWLVNRLILAAKIENIDKEPFRFMFTAKGSSREPKELWKGLAKWLGNGNNLPPAEVIVEQVYQLWQRQSVILKIRGIQNARQEDIEAFLQTFWEQLMKMIAERAGQGQKSPNHYLLLFLIDNQGEVGQWKSNWRDQFEVPAIPVKLKEIQKIKYEDIEVWTRGNQDILPEKRAPQIVLAEEDVPEITLEKICMMYGYTLPYQEGARW